MRKKRKTRPVASATTGRESAIQHRHNTNGHQGKRLFKFVPMSAQAGGMIGTGKYEAHEFAKLIRKPTEAEQAALNKNIANQGLIDAITLFEGKVLDGRSRQIACLRVGKEPRYEEFKGTRSQALAFAFAKNVSRRHLTKQEIVKAARELLKLEAAEKDKGGSDHDMMSRSVGGKGGGSTKDPFKAAVKQRAEEMAGEPITDRTVERALTDEPTREHKSKRKPKVDNRTNTTKQFVVQRFNKFMGYWAVTAQRDVRQVLRDMLSPSEKAK